MLRVRWDNKSEQWIRRLGEFADLLYPHLGRAISKTMKFAVLTAKPRIPVFEHDLERDLRVLGVVRKFNRKLRVVGTMGFTDATIMPSYESKNGPSPFSIPMGKHKPGARPHGVMLYFPGTKGSTPGRAKLVRWLKQHGNAMYQSLPDAPTKEDVDEWQQRVETATGVKPPPFVEVDPSQSATDFLWWLIEQDGDPLASVLVDNVMRAVKRVWEM